MPNVVLVTGASGGIGRSVVEALSPSAAVVATDLLAPPAPDGGAAHPLDVRDPESWREVLDRTEERWGRLDALINVAGVARAGNFLELDPAQIDAHLQVNVRGAALGMRLALPGMVARGSGHVVNVGSLSALAPVPGIALYSATKFALRALTHAVALELTGTGVSVSVVHPDLVDTPMIWPQLEQPQAATSFSSARILSAEEVARAIVKVLGRERSQEVALPAARGLVCKLAGAFPGVARALGPHMRRRGLARQAALRARRSPHSLAPGDPT